MTIAIVGRMERAIPRLFGEALKARRISMKADGKLELRSLAPNESSIDFVASGITQVYLLPGPPSIGERAFLSNPDLRARFREGDTSIFDLRDLGEGSSLDSKLVSLLSSGSSKRAEAYQIYQHDQRVVFYDKRVDKEKNALSLGSAATELPAGGSSSDGRLDFTGQEESFTRYNILDEEITPDSVNRFLIAALSVLEAEGPKEGRTDMWPGTRSGAVLDFTTTNDLLAILPAKATSTALAEWLSERAASALDIRDHCGRQTIFGRFPSDRKRVIDATKKEVAFGSTAVENIELRLFLPFRLGKTPGNTNGGPGLDDEARERCKDYFHGHLHGLLGLGGSSEGLICTETVSETGVEVKIRHPSYAKGKPLTAKLESHRLHLLGATKKNRSERGGTGKSRPIGLVEAVISVPPDTLSRVLDTIAEVRILRRNYPPKALDNNGDLVEIESSWSSDVTLWDHIVKVCDLGDAEPLGDDRAFVFQSLILEGDPPVPDGEGARMAEVTLARMMTVDGYGTGHFYAEDFATAELARGRLDRFEGSDFVVTGHSFGFRGYLGFRTKSFALAEVHNIHMPQIYRIMVIYALLVAARLEALDRDLDHAGAVADKVWKVRQDYTSFLAQCWRPELSSQIQGRELFDRMRRQMRLDDRITALDARMKRSEILAAEERQKRQIELEEMAGNRSQVMSFLFSVFATLLAFYALVDREKLPPAPAFFGKLVGSPVLAFGAALVIGAGVWGAIWIGARLWRGFDRLNCANRVKTVTVCALVVLAFLALVDLAQ